MQNVKSTSSLCSSNLLEAHVRWLFDFVHGCETPFVPSHCLLLLLVCNSSCSQSKLLLFLVGNSSYSWVATPIALGHNSFYYWFTTPLVVGLQLLLVLVRTPLALSWQLFLLLVRSSSCSWSLVLLSLGLGLTLLGHGPTPFALGSQLLLVLVRAPFGPS